MKLLLDLLRAIFGDDYSDREDLADWAGFL